MYLNKELTGKFSLRSLISIGMIVGTITLALFVAPNSLWPYWIIFAVNQLGGALAWINLGALLSLKAPEHMQGRVMGVGGSMWSIGQILAPLIAGPLAGWNMHSPLLAGALCIAISLVFFLVFYREKAKARS
jgi:MFS family permease